MSAMDYLTGALYRASNVGEIFLIAILLILDVLLRFENPDSPEIPSIERPQFSLYWLCFVCMYIVHPLLI